MRKIKSSLIQNRSGCKETLQRVDWVTKAFEVSCYFDKGGIYCGSSYLAQAALQIIKHLHWRKVAGRASVLAALCLVNVWRLAIL